MALDATNEIINSTHGYVVQGTAVRSGYFVTETIAAIPSHACVTGTLCYCTGTTSTPVNKFYQYNGAAWVETSVKNQNAFSNVTVGNTTVTADSITDTLTLVGSNVTITPDSANDKITFTVADGSTTTKGIVQLSDAIDSSSTTTAATANAVKKVSDKIDALDVSTPTASGNTTSFIDTISQTDGKISATKKTITSATTSTPGIVQLNDAINSTSTSQAATANAVKKVSDKIDDLVFTDETVTLAKQLKTYYSVGKVTASGTSPVVIGNQGDTLRQVFDNLFNMAEVQPSITSNPSISTCSLTSTASDERGTTISSVSYSITFEDGAYTNSSSTGSTMTSYSFSSGTPSSTTSTTGTLTLPSTYTVGSSSAFSTTLTANYSQGNVAKTNLGNNSNPVIRIAAGSCTKSASFSKTAVDYPYFLSSSSTSLTSVTSATQKAASLATTSGASCSYSASNYVWIFIRKGSSTSQPTKTIETYSEIAKAWGTLLGGTEKKGEVSLKKANGVTDTFYAYKTKNAAQAGATFTLRLK